MIKKYQQTGKRGLITQERTLLKRPSDYKKDPITEKPKENSITEDVKENSITKDVKEDLITEDPQ